MPQRIAVLADIHGNLPALEAVVADLTRRQVERVFNLGDHISGPLWPRETIHYLMQQDWLQIKGNHDRQLVDQDPNEQGASDRYASQFLTDRERSWLRALPASLTVQAEFHLFHGTPHSDLTYLLETIEHGRTRLATPAEIRHRVGDVPGRVLLCGHTHMPRVVYLPENRLIVNPGSVGLPAYEDDSSEPHVMETGSPHARYAVLERQNEAWVVDLIAVDYDYRQAADQARRNNRLDWATGLLTGYMHALTN